MKKLIIILVIGLICAGCSSTSSRNIGVVDTSGKFEVEVINPLLEADVEIGKKTTGTAANGVFMFIFPFGDNGKVYGFDWLDTPIIPGLAIQLPFSGAEGKGARDFATYRACKNVGADFLVAPRYVIKKYSFFGFYKTYEATVTGFAGRYKGFKSVPEEAKKCYEKKLQNL